MYLTTHDFIATVSINSNQNNTVFFSCCTVRTFIQYTHDKLYYLLIAALCARYHIKWKICTPFCVPFSRLFPLLFLSSIVSNQVKSFLLKNHWTREWERKGESNVLAKWFWMNIIYVRKMKSKDGPFDERRNRSWFLLLLLKVVFIGTNKMKLDFHFWGFVCTSNFTFDCSSASNLQCI